MRVLILGAGWIAHYHAESFQKVQGVELVGAVDLVADKLEAFCAQHGIANKFATLEEAVTWGQFDAAVNATPDAVHYETTFKLIEAGKHIFCEKPLSISADKAMEMTEAVEKAGVVGMVNLTYRSSPALQKAREMVLAGEIGEVRHVDAAMLHGWLVGNHWGDWKTDSKWLWRLSKKHGSNGALGDTGIHVVDFASYGAALDVAHVFARLKTFDKAPGNKIGEYDLDANDGFIMNVDFSNGAIGTIHATRTAAGYDNMLRMWIYGSLGSLEVIYDTGKSTLRACIGSDVNTHTWKDIPLEPVPTNHETFLRAVRSGKTLEPAFRKAAELQKVLDQAAVSNDRHVDQTIK